VIAEQYLADLFTLRLRTEPPSAVRAMLRRRSSDELDDGVTHGWQAWLRRWSVASFFRPSIAVLPFQNMSGDPEQDYFADNGRIKQNFIPLSGRESRAEKPLRGGLQGRSVRI
jgi:hypothetical protein